MFDANDDSSLNYKFSALPYPYRIEFKYQGPVNIVDDDKNFNNKIMSPRSNLSLREKRNFILKKKNKLTALEKQLKSYI